MRGRPVDDAYVPSEAAQLDPAGAGRAAAADFSSALRSSSRKIVDRRWLLDHNAAGLDDATYDIAAQASAAWEAAVRWDNAYAVKRMLPVSEFVVVSRANHESGPESAVVHSQLDILHAGYQVIVRVEYLEAWCPAQTQGHRICSPVD
jgi:hypothetical protein